MERDWSYVARRQYNYDVELNSFGRGFLFGNIMQSIFIFQQKKFVLWPLIVFGTAAKLYWTPVLFTKHSKKIFDMCNVGEEYYFGSIFDSFRKKEK